MFLMTTCRNGGFVAPQHLAFGTSVTCEVRLYEPSTYGPLPAPAEADELNHCSALSVVEASGASVPPWASTNFALTIPVDGVARIDGSCAAGVFDLMTTV